MKSVKMVLLTPVGVVCVIIGLSLYAGSGSGNWKVKSKENAFAGAMSQSSTSKGTVLTYFCLFDDDICVWRIDNAGICQDTDDTPMFTLVELNVNFSVICAGSPDFAIVGMAYYEGTSDFADIDNLMVRREQNGGKLTIDQWSGHEPFQLSLAEFDLTGLTAAMRQTKEKIAAMR